MADARMVDQTIGVFDRTQLWMALRLLHGFDLSDFLFGSRHAYRVVSDLVQSAQWDALSPLVQPSCLEAMQVLAPNVALLPADADTTISIRSAALQSARLLEPCATRNIVKGTTHLDVRFVSLQGITLHDLSHGVPPVAQPRLQESTWTFEVCLASPCPCPCPCRPASIS